MASQSCLESTQRPFSNLSDGAVALAILDFVEPLANRFAGDGGLAFDESTCHLAAIHWFGRSFRGRLGSFAGLEQLARRAACLGRATLALGRSGLPGGCCRLQAIGSH